MLLDDNNSKKMIGPLIDACVADNFDVISVSLCTEDGFTIYHKNSAHVEIESDKVAAIASSLMSMSEASIKSIDGGRLKMTIVESEKANLLLTNAVCMKTPVVLAIAISNKLSMGQSLFITNRLSKALAQLANPV